jgi:hypothetical protein
VVTTDSSLTADLTLAGTACNVYSDDIKDLKLVVEYQSSKWLSTFYLRYDILVNSLTDAA